MNLKIVNSLNEKDWRTFVKDQPSGNIFHTPEMFQVFGRTRGCLPELYAAIDQHGQIQSLLTPVQVSLRDGFMQRMMTRSIVYGGALFVSDQKGKSALRAILDESDRKTKNKALFTELRHLSDIALVKDTFSECGYGYEEHLNYLIDISLSPEEVMENIGSRTRKNIRRALRKGNVNIELVSSNSQLKCWYDLIQKSYRKAKVPLTDFSLFQAAFDILSPKGMARFYLAKVDETFVAATAELPYKDVIYGWYSGVDRDFSSEYPGELLMWEILRWGAENGYSVYDFGGAGKPNEPSGVRDFKAKFGGQLVSFGRNTKIHAPLLMNVSRVGYELYRKVLPGS